MPLPRRLITSLTLCAALLLPAAASAAKPSTLEARFHASPPRAYSAQRDCPNADAQPTRANAAAIRAAVLCLHNQIRAEHGLPPLRENARLRRAATRHSADMVARRFFEHTTPTGATMVDRIMRAHYMVRSRAWALGENIAWGTGSLATPRGVMRAWMESPGHRDNILRRSYRELGIGVAVGIPTGGSGEGATFTADLGVRH